MNFFFVPRIINETNVFIVSPLGPPIQASLSHATLKIQLGYLLRMLKKNFESANVFCHYLLTNNTIFAFVLLLRKRNFKRLVITDVNIGFIHFTQILDLGLNIKKSKLKRKTRSVTRLEIFKLCAFQRNNKYISTLCLNIENPIGKKIYYAFGRFQVVRFSWKQLCIDLDLILVK